MAKAVAELSGTRALLLYVWNIGNNKMIYDTDPAKFFLIV